MRLLAIAIAVTVSAVSVRAQSVSDYLKLRTLRHIVQPCSCQTLDQLIGTRIVELQGVAQGSFKSQDTISVIIRRSDGESQVVDCPTPPPDWVLNGEVAVRALIKVTRGAEYGPATSSLVSIAPEDAIRKVDDAYWRKEAAKNPPKRSKPLASRGGGDMYGWIGNPHPNQEWIVSAQDATPAYARFILRRNPRLSESSALQIARAVIGFSGYYGFDPRLVMAVLMVESDFDPTSTNSKSGAMGLGQLMPGTAEWMGVHNAYDPTDNLNGAIKLLRTHFNQYMAQTHDTTSALVLTLAAYNAGMGAVKKYGGVPPYRETQAYVARIIQIYNRLRSH